MSRPQSHLDVIKPEFIQTLKDKAVLVIGDVMLDVYLLGEADRISPEAPVPIVNIKSERELLGGAGNVVRNIADLGGQATLVGAVGQDQRGERVHSLLCNKGIQSSLVSLPGRHTTVKTRIMAQRQQMIRLDHENDTPYEKDELNVLLETLDKHIAEHEIIILSDYSKGIVSDFFMFRFKEMLASKNPHAKVLIDPKPSHTALYHGAFALTPNIKETGESAGGMPVGNRDEILAAGRTIMKLTDAKYLLTTLGASGMALFLSLEDVWHIPTVARDVFDVTGAGDTVIATFGLALSAGFDPLVSAILANYAAGIVVGQVGVATVSPLELEEAITSLPQPEVSLWC